VHDEHEVRPRADLPALLQRIAQAVTEPLPAAAYEALQSAPDATVSDAPQVIMEAESADVRRGLKGRAAPAPPPKLTYPPGLQVQTGPAVPDWRWHQAPLRWDGPVSAGQPFSLTLAPPLLTRTLYVAGPVLLLGLLAVFAIAILPASVTLPDGIARFVRHAPRTAVSLLLLAPLATLSAGLAPARAVAADFPGPELLDQLEQRLTAAPACMPGCAAHRNFKRSTLSAGLAPARAVAADFPGRIAHSA
jgi:flagellar biosynthesis protein FliQ